MFYRSSDKELLRHYRFIVKQQNQIIESLLALSRRQRTRIDKLSAPQQSTSPDKEQKETA